MAWLERTMVELKVETEIRGKKVRLFFSFKTSSTNFSLQSRGFGEDMRDVNDHNRQMAGNYVDEGKEQI